MKEADIEEYLRIVRSEMNMNIDADEEEVRNLISEIVFRETKNKGVNLKEKERLTKTLFDSVRRLDVLQELMDDDSVSEIMVNGYDRIFIEKNGNLVAWDKQFTSEEKYEDVLQRIVAACNRTVNESCPIADARLYDGSRANIVLNPLSVNGATLTIRKFPKEVYTLDKLVDNGSVTRECADFLSDAVKAGYNCFVSGGTSSGKTTMLNALSGCIPSDERVITIEDSAELQIKNIPNLVSLETRDANSSGCTSITIRDLIRASLRMRPDRIIVGEVRGAEVTDMLQAFNTGHEGSLSTGHANSSADMLVRLEAMYLQGMEIPLEAIRRQIASGIDIMIHLERGRDGRRRVTEVNEVTGVGDKRVEIRPLFGEELCDKEYSFIKKGDLTNTKKMERWYGLRKNSI